ncbi:lantibiotic dehydratase [Bacillus sp. 179-I 2A5 NHS]|uniref:lantibiotic dehydratase n=1 Tax=Bacillus TaxID=1386 RepID=UPI000BF7AA4A|nr:lantibiotic dehydratase [Bacillus cereus]PER22507.1 hypothetical protein CN476_20495 [Bacillus cereus]
MITKEDDLKNTSLTTESSIFCALDFFMIRTPLLPIEVYKECFDLVGKQDIEQYEMGIENLQELSSNPVIRETIAVASNALHSSLDNINLSTNNKKKRQTIDSFSRYLNRMTTRPTPYGIFSGVSHGKFHNLGNISLEGVNQFKKRARADMEWLLKLVEVLEKSEEIMDDLYITTNTSAYKNGNRLKIPYHTGYGQQLTQENAFVINYHSISYTPVVKQVLEIAKERLVFKDLIKEVSNLYPDTSKAIIYKFVKQLLNEEFLISELRPPFMCTNPFNHVLNILLRVDKNSNFTTELVEIKEYIEQYNALSIGTGENLLKLINHKMNSIVQVKNPLQVDLVIKEKNNTLTYEIKENVEKAAELLWKLSPPVIGFSHLSQYRNEFLEKYGPYREVHILDLLDEDIGLGAPATYKYPKSPYSYNEPISDFQKNREKFLNKWIMEAVNKGEMEIEIDHNRLKDIEDNEVDDEKAPLSMELYFSILSRSKDALNKGDYKMILSPNPGSEGAGKTFGRFIDLFDTEVTEKMNSIHNLEQEIEEDAIFAEIVYLPPAGRNSNVALTENIRPYEIVIGTNSSKGANHTIPLSDIVVGATFDSFYLKSKSLNKKIIPTNNHMLNYLTAPNVCRFLAEIGLEGRKRWMSFDWGNLGDLPVLPRIKSGNIIISPAEWKINQDTFDKQDINETHKWNNLINIWRDKWKVSKYVFLTVGDNRLLLDLDNPLHLEIIRKDYTKLTSGQSLRLIEVDDDILDSWVTSEQGTYLVECVFPLVKKHNERLSNVIDAPREDINKTIIGDERLKFPGSEWLYVKLYGMGQRQEEFISKSLKEFVHSAQKEGWLDSWFFIRYADPKHHLRIRFKGDPHLIQTKGLIAFYKWSQQLREEGMLSNLTIDTYDPEIERYGGDKLILEAENLFFADSSLISNLIELKRWKKIDLDEEVLGVINVISIFEGLGFTFEKTLNWLNDSLNYKEYLVEFREKRSILLKVANSHEEWKSLREEPNGLTIYNLFLKRNYYLEKYSREIEEEKSKGKLTNDYDDIVGSVIHMSLNRLIGVNREKEKKIMALARHTLHNLRYLRRKQ